MNTFNLEKMINRIYSSIMFRFLSLFSLNKIKTEEKVIYLTFDDGPEPGITETILNLLNEYNAKATFFCTGKNFEKHSELVQLIKDNGHCLGNHTYSHLNALKESYKNYINDANKGKEIIQSNLFRPPWGALSVCTFLNLRKKNKLILWSITSKDTYPNTDWEKHCQLMVNETKPGSIVLFHFSLKHAVRTLQILPIYMKRINEMNFKYYLLKD